MCFADFRDLKSVTNFPQGMQLSFFPRMCQLSSWGMRFLIVCKRGRNFRNRAFHVWSFYFFPCSTFLSYITRENISWFFYWFGFMPSYRLSSHLEFFEFFENFLLFYLHYLVLNFLWKFYCNLNEEWSLGTSDCGEIFWKNWTFLGRTWIVIWILVWKMIKN